MNKIIQTEKGLVQGVPCDGYTLVKPHTILSRVRLHDNSHIRHVCFLLVLL